METETRRGRPLEYPRHHHIRLTDDMDRDIRRYAIKHRIGLGEAIRRLLGQVLSGAVNPSARQSERR